MEVSLTGGFLDSGKLGVKVADVSGPLVTSSLHAFTLLLNFHGLLCIAKEQCLVNLFLTVWH